jgi:thiopeptide-type bacteriocin biosynthesis protein
MNYTFYPLLIVRTPAKAYSDFDTDCLASLLLKPDFQYALSLASPDLFDALQNLSFDFTKLSQKLQLAVYRYYNRMSFRPTPFGAFASVGTAEWSDNGQQLVREETAKLMTFRNFGEALALNSNKEKDLIHINKSIYRVGDQLRFIFRQVHEGKRASFRLMSIPRSKPLIALVKKVEVPADSSEITEFLDKSLFQTDSAKLLRKLIGAQVLLQSEPRVTGSFTALTETQEQSSGQTYTLAFHNQRGSLPARYQNDLKEALHALDILAPVEENGLQEFKVKFSRKYETAEVPLLKALDPQLGVGYLEFESKPFQEPKELDTSENLEGKASMAAWSAISAMLLEKITERDRAQHFPVSISERDIAALGKSGNNISNPPSLSIMFRVTEDDKIFIEQSGGSSALNIAGRFSHHPEILQHLRCIASSEQNCNTDVVFAEIAATDNFLTDNINSRGHLREYEIPILTQSSLPAERVIELSDLYVRVVANRIILHSKRLNRIVVPRLATAYNYRLSNLPVLRFLAELQHQDLRSNFNFDPEYFLPGLKFYPRITYKNVVLSPARWIWKQQVFASFSDSDVGKQLFREQALSMGISRYFALTTHDQQLVFDLNSEQSVSYFLRIITGHTRVVLQEYFFTSEQACVRNKNGGQYVTQFVAFLVNQEKTYTGPSPVIARKSGSVLFLPAQEWLYLKIYGHPKTIAALLADPVFDRMLTKLLQLKKISNWFFVRYADPNVHLRLRLKCKPRCMAEVYAKVKRWLTNYLKVGLVSDFLIGTYQPEIHRYGFAGMERVELIFQRSSHLVLEFHKQQKDADRCIAAGLASVGEILAAFFPDCKETIDFLEKTIKSMEFDKSERLEMDKYYRQHRQSLESTIANALYYPGMKEFRESCVALVNVNDKQGLLFGNLVLDLIHMHVNRINTLLAIDIEKKIYYWLLKHYKTLYHKQSGFKSGV